MGKSSDLSFPALAYIGRSDDTRQNTLLGGGMHFEHVELGQVSIIANRNGSSSSLKKQQVRERETEVLQRKTCHCNYEYNVAEVYCSCGVVILFCAVTVTPVSITFPLGKICWRTRKKYLNIDHIAMCYVLTATGSMRE